MYRSFFLQLYFNSFELIGKKAQYNDFAFHISNHVGICWMSMWVRKTVYDFSISQNFFLNKMTSFTEKCGFFQNTDCETSNNWIVDLTHFLRETLIFLKWIICSLYYYYLPAKEKSRKLCNLELQNCNNTYT